ncbi:MAG: hypothetical protein HN742_39720 [Lentisphaerae bacterium]|jgi:hypothetical protein|nr:hypothetical protein [Lentisphaerota bacterium]MBT4814256.1 hypothetical protein [Lentisphaerota bacterium]MBT5610968.1 hypothetical protein [Lentisphaerota bacterium]MBT7058063.1 hypothetical protein [Lentisphaerota bacterium]MBT7848064.1 hypothetical protein [Lentisphaerota bacterium]
MSTLRTALAGALLLGLGTIPHVEAAGPRVHARPFPTETRLVRNGRTDVLILHGAAHADLAKKLQSQLRELCGIELPLMLDTDATAGRRWTLRDDVEQRNLIVLGDINTNRGVLALYAKFLAAATGAYPGPGRYILRHLAEPFVPGRTALVIGASDPVGLKHGMARLLALLRAAPEPTLSFPLLEFGAADGPTDIPETGSETFRDYRDAAYVFYSGGRPTHRYAWFGLRNVQVAQRVARDLVLAETGKDTPCINVGGHYTFIPNYQALRIIIAHGLLSADELRALEEKLIDNALTHKDSYVTYFNGRYKRTMSTTNGNPSRHSSSTIVGQYLLLDYLMSFADLTDDVRGEVAKHHASYSKIIRDWDKTHIFRARTGDLEALDCTAFMIYGFMHMGLEEFVSNGVLENMANFYLNNVNNLWCDAGSSHYIGAYRGCHIRSPDGGLAVRALAFFTRNTGLEFLDTQRFEKAGTYQRGFFDKARMCLGQPEPFALPATAGDASTLACPMLRKTPIDPMMWHSTASAAEKAGSPLPLTLDQAYDTIGFRDGWSADDAFLAIKGLHAGRLWQVNTIVGYTDRGARFLFGGSQTHENWYRSSITVDTAAFLPQDAFARLEAYVSTPDTALIASTCTRFNGTRWQRTILRHRDAYFAVLDDLTALSENDFHIAATWRVLPPGQIDDDGAFRATGHNGAEFAIIPGGRRAAEVTRPPVDGVARPTFYRQHLDTHLSAGDTASFHNVIASSPRGQEAAVSAKTVGDGRLLRVQDLKRASTALIGTGALPVGRGFAGGTCAAFYLSEDLCLLGGAEEIFLDGRLLVRSSRPVDLVLNWTNNKAEVRVHGANPATVVLAATLGGTDEEQVLQPGDHTFPLLLPRQDGFRTNAEALPQTPAQGPQPPEDDRTGNTDVVELWSKQVQAQPARIVHPVSIQAPQAPDMMAVHNLHDGVLWSSSIPAPTWRIPELVLTLTPPPDTPSITGLRMIGNVGRIEIEEEREPGQYTRLPAEETEETLFAGYSDNRVGGRLYTGRRLNFNGAGRQLRVIVSAADPETPSVHIGEIQLLGPAGTHSAWGRLLVDRLTPDAEPVLFSRTGTYVDTVERGGTLRTLSLDGTQLWSHPETAPAQYRAAYWLTADVDSDGSKELVTYADDMILRVFKGDGRTATTADLHAWEGERKGAPIGHMTYGGKSIAAWPVQPDGRPDLFVFGHVHHHQIRLGGEPQVTRRDRVPTWDCAPSASTPVSGWSAPGKQNLVGVAPYATGIILLEADVPDGPPKLIVQRAFSPPLVQPSANNQQPVFVACLPLQSPEGVVAVTPRGAQLFAKPDLTPGWVAAGTCPTSAATLVRGDGDDPDLVLLGRENGRLLQVDAATGGLRAKTLLNGSVRKIAVSDTGTVFVGTSHALFILDSGLNVIGNHKVPVEDIALAEAAGNTTVFVLASTGRLQALRLNARAR